MQPFRRITLGLILLASVAACASSGNQPETGGVETTVQIENQNFLDMTVYVYEGGQRVRLGTVPGVSSRTFPIPERILFGISALRFEADPVGSQQTSFSDEIAISPGESLRLVIPPR